MSLSLRIGDKLVGWHKLQSPEYLQLLIKVIEILYFVTIQCKYVLHITFNLRIKLNKNLHK